MRAWLTQLLAVRERPLRARLAALTAAAVASAVALTGVAAWLITRITVYNQLDNELVDIAAVTANWVAVDIEGMGGLDTNALKAANVTVMLVRSDNRISTLPGASVTLVPGVQELSVARRQQGWSARTGEASNGQPYRIVAVPLTSSDESYALVLGRPLEPTNNIMATLAWSLTFFGVLGVGVSSAIGFVIARSAIRPVERLSEAVARVTDTNELNPIEVDGSGELEDLSRSFNTMLRSLQLSRERQRRLIADAGHELRTPLTSLRTNVELLVADERSRMLPEGARADILRDVAGQLGEFTTLVGDLVLLSREDSMQPHPEPVDLRDVVNSAVARAKRRGPSLTFDVELHPFYLVGEPDLLERAITNLLDNAVKFSPPSGTVHVLLEGDRLRISDQGPGIPDDELPHVFDRFWRSPSARNTPGSGLGLSIVAQTIKAHGGWVKAGRSAEGGAEFIVRLPGSSTAPEDAPDEESTALLPRIHG
ncbi:sensor histidine kinase [Micropruina sonneratiae]|uniref:sensor histidine kinase n=1 Tax=Micropruina sonneratiae TaxID=2986940 RepID=UPI0022260518|nr:HAMP domain-containing sensor histidine kinase [Micropruina sp. KQZ13P-5]MCW3159180.1 HAMP domain-containing histidine kinase [Micropruina sp. KQZ13P-5]